MRWLPLLLLVVLPAAAQDVIVVGRPLGGVQTITFVAAAVSNNGSAVDDIPTLSYPAGTAANDIAIVLMATSSSHNTSGTPPTGWTKIFERDSATTSDTSISTFWKRLAGGETSDTWTNIFDAGENCVAAMIVYRGCIATGSPVEDFDSADSAAGTAKDMPSSTSLGIGRMFVAVMGSDPDGDPATTMTWDSPAVERVDRDTTPSGGYGTNAAAYTAEYLRPTAGATALAGDLAASEETACGQIVLIPASL